LSAVRTEWDAVQTALAVRSKKILAVRTDPTVGSEKILALRSNKRKKIILCFVEPEI